jgi:hypothetical protein
MISTNTPSYEQDLEWLKNKWPKAYNTLFGYTKILQEQINIAALFIMNFENFKDTVEDKFEFFFSDSFEINDKGEFVYTKSKKYEEIKNQMASKYKEVYKRLYKKNCQKTPGLFEISCAWFHDMGALEDDDIIAIVWASYIRNDFAHELYKNLLDDSKSVFDKDLVLLPIGLQHKVSNWWIREFEQSISPEEYEKYSDEDMQSATAMNVHFLQVIQQRLLTD